MITANTMVTALAAATGMLLVSSPNTNQHKVPNAKSEYINKEMPVVSFVRMVFNACGRKEIVVKNAAIKPITVIIIYDRKINKYSHSSSNRSIGKVTKSYL
jgi:5'(3')-deoxyribonucleotidase